MKTIAAHSTNFTNFHILSVTCYFVASFSILLVINHVVTGIPIENWERSKFFMYIGFLSLGINRFLEHILSMIHPLAVLKIKSHCDDLHSAWTTLTMFIILTWQGTTWFGVLYDELGFVSALIAVGFIVFGICNLYEVIVNRIRAIFPIKMLIGVEIAKLKLLSDFAKLGIEKAQEMLPVQEEFIQKLHQCEEN